MGMNPAWEVSRPAVAPEPDTLPPVPACLTGTR